MHKGRQTWRVDVEAVIARLEEMVQAPDLPSWKADRIQDALRNAHAFLHID